MMMTTKLLLAASAALTLAGQTYAESVEIIDRFGAVENEVSYASTVGVLRTEDQDSSQTRNTVTVRREGVATQQGAEDLQIRLAAVSAIFDRQFAVGGAFELNRANASDVLLNNFQLGGDGGQANATEVNAQLFEDIQPGESRGLVSSDSDEPIGAVVFTVTETSDFQLRTQSRLFDEPSSIVTRLARVPDADSALNGDATPASLTAQQSDILFESINQEFGRQGITILDGVSEGLGFFSSIPGLNRPQELVDQSDALSSFSVDGFDDTTDSLLAEAFASPFVSGFNNDVPLDFGSGGTINLTGTLVPAPTSLLFRCLARAWTSRSRTSRSARPN